jgi:hypothetical protein
MPWCVDIKDNREKGRLPMRQRGEKRYKVRDVRESRGGDGRTMGT